MDRLFALYRSTASTGAVVALILANLTPLVGVLFFDWSVWTILVVYWLENGVVGVFNVLKMRRAAAPYIPGRVPITFNGQPAGEASKASLIGFFILHYGIFWTVHGVFVLAFASGALSIATGPSAAAPSVWTIPLALIALFVSHGMAYRLDYLGRGEYLRTSAATQMFAPYGRLLILHITIIVGAFAISATGAPAAAVVILIVLKTGLDLGLQLVERARVGSRQPA
jgi:hypothetical protein